MSSEDEQPRYNDDRREYWVTEAVGWALTGCPGLAILWMIILSLGGSLQWSNWQRVLFVVACLTITLIGEAIESTVKRAKELERTAHRMSQTIWGYEQERRRD
jgi:hypothetical protein